MDTNCRIALASFSVLADTGKSILENSKSIDKTSKIVSSFPTCKDISTLRNFISNKGYDYTLLFNDRFYVYVSKNHPLAQHKSVSINELLNYRGICYSNEELAKITFDTLFDPQNTMYLSRQEYILKAVSQNKGYTVFNAFMGSYTHNLLFQNIVSIPITDYNFQSIFYLAYPKEHSINAAEKLIVNSIINFFKNSFCHNITNVV
ncbi:MAG: LysR family transcriptional regulator substrate-binding protein [Peptococcales bacterium]|jgi:DNA-binding transcriptional LysR family regulator